MIKMGRKINASIKSYKNSIYQFNYKENVVMELVKVARGTPGFRGRRFQVPRWLVFVTVNKRQNTADLQNKTYE
jgi:hypothetical protein